MHKYTKWALVLLYLLQLVVVFREQLVHLYKSALHSVNGTEEPVRENAGALGAAADLVKRAVTLTRPVSRESLSALPGLMFPVAIISHEGEGNHEEHHDGDEDKDWARKQRRRRLRQHLIQNLWESLRVSIAHGERREPCSEIARVLIFA